MHQLAADGSICARLGREVQRSRISGDRVHTPEFEFEKNIDNVRWANRTMRINYPVAVDNEHLIWRAFKNQYWPALYFVEGRGAFDIIISARVHTNSQK